MSHLFCQLISRLTHILGQRVSQTSQLGCHQNKYTAADQIYKPNTPPAFIMYLYKLKKVMSGEPRQHANAVASLSPLLKILCFVYFAENWTFESLPCFVLFHFQGTLMEITYRCTSRYVKFKSYDTGEQLCDLVQYNQMSFPLKIAA